MPRYHPKPDDNGQPVRLFRPSKATPLDRWAAPTALATTTPGAPLPAELAGLALRAWEAPTTAAGWLALVPSDFVEPPQAGIDPDGEPRAGPPISVSGIIGQEADGRIWIVHPSNGYAGYKATFPKGQLEATLSLAANALKEGYEESGLRFRLVRHLFDVERGSSVARYYLGQRIGGSPADMGWESQAVSLCPIDRLAKVLVNPKDAATIALITARLAGR